MVPNVLKKAAEAEGESDRLRIEAEGRAKTIEVEGRALAQNPQILRLKELEMQMRLAESAKGWQTVVMSSGQAGQLLNIGGNKQIFNLLKTLQFCGVFICRKRFISSPKENSNENECS